MSSAPANASSVPATRAATSLTDSERQRKMDEALNRVVSYVPIGEIDPIELTIGSVMNTLSVKSRSGAKPGWNDAIKFLMLCKSRRLNPFTNDAYLVGYDDQGGTTWTLITAIQALLKRAEVHPAYDGCSHGVIIRRADKIIEFREGSFYDDGEVLLGGWADVYRKDRSQPTRNTVKLAAFDKGRALWKVMAGHLISKCALAGGLREAFPSDVAGMYLAEEFDGESRSSAIEKKLPNPTGAASRAKPLTLGDLSREMPGQVPQPAQTRQTQQVVEDHAPHDASEIPVDLHEGTEETEEITVASASQDVAQAAEPKTDKQYLGEIDAAKDAQTLQVVANAIADDPDLTEAARGGLLDECDKAADVIAARGKRNSRRGGQKTAFDPAPQAHEQ